MADYDFKVLSPIDFEILIRDLLQKELRIRIESFKAGKDAGIDLRYAVNNRCRLIVQCKHYSESGFPALIRHLQHEVAKVARLRPERYIIATSLGLSPGNKESIRRMFRRFIRSEQDILGREDINNLLVKHKDIERQTFKLWFTSVNVFEEILNRKVKNVSRDCLESIREKAKYFVQNPSFACALSKLKSSNFCIIAGNPGIGKTTLAEMLILHFIERGYDLVRIESDISEARVVDYTNERRLFYYDDFLGQASLAEKLNKNEDQKLLDFLASIKKSKMSKMILTTREYILNQTKLRYEKMDRCRFDPETCVIDLGQYTRLIRTQILFNHVHFSEIGDSLKSALVRDKAYLGIIDHDNYSPRIVQMMTDPAWVIDLDGRRYVKAFIGNLNNPMHLWRHAFEQQLSRNAKVLLCVLATLPTEAMLEDLGIAFAGTYRLYANEHHWVTASNDLETALRELEGNFIAIGRSDSQPTVKFHNPSIRDFMANYLIHHGDDVRFLIQAAPFFEQLTWLWRFEGGVHRGDTFLPLIRTNLTQFGDALARTIGAPSFKQRYRWVKDEWRYDSVSLEERLEVVASVINVLPIRELASLMDTYLEKVTARMRRSEMNKRDLVRLLAELTKLTRFREYVRNIMLPAARACFLRFTGRVRDFEALREFSAAHPRAFLKQERAFIAKEFRDLCAEAPDDEDDADSIREHASQIEDLASSFKVDVADRLEYLEDLACKKEREAESRASEEKSELSAPKIDEDECDDKEIASIFGSLRSVARRRRSLAKRL